MEMKDQMEWEKGVHLKLVLQLIDMIYPSGGLQRFISHFVMLKKASAKSVMRQGWSDPMVFKDHDTPKDIVVLALRLSFHSFIHDLKGKEIGIQR
jgi:hypothetical protein